MAKVIEFYVRDLFPKKVMRLPRDQRGKVIAFPQEKSTLAAKADQIPELDFGNSMEPASQLSLGQDGSEQHCHSRV
jgi:hypothetical protein